MLVMPLATSDFVGILDSMREGFQVIDREMRYVHLNVAAAGHGRTTSDAQIGRAHA